MKCTGECAVDESARESIAIVVDLLARAAGAVAALVRLIAAIVTAFDAPASP